jgi:transposase
MKEGLKLTEVEEQHLHMFVHRGKANARSITRGRIVLKLSEGWSDDQITAAFDICRATVGNVRKRFGEGGVEAVLHDKVQLRRRQALAGQQAAHLIAIACSPVPDGHDHWTVRMLADKAVELGFVSSISPDTIHQLFKKTNSNPGNTSTGVCPPSEASL